MIPPYCDGEWWWASHTGTGTNGRPRPGTRVRIAEGDRYGGRRGTVAYYEGQWNAHLFPVRVDFTGVTLMYLPGDVIDVATLPEPKPRSPRSRAGAS